MELPSAKRLRCEDECSENADPVITLNVGGTRMQTRRTTLTWSSAYFHNILSGPFKSDNGELFLDCDAAAFAHVLDFFRHRELRPEAPLRDVHNVAKLYSIDLLLEETEKRIEIRSMVGTWGYVVSRKNTLQTVRYTIIEHESVLWFYETVFGKTNKGKLRKEGEYYIAQEDWGQLRLMRWGDTMMSNYRKKSEDPWEDDTHAERVHLNVTI